MTSAPDICLIAAVGRGRAIGRAGQLAFHIGADLRHFKQLTMGHPLIMGRLTFESLPGGALPGRRNIVVTRNAGFAAPGVECAPSLAEAVAMCAGADRVMVIGGGQIYAQALPMATSMELTEIDVDCPGADTFFPAYDPAEWSLVSSTPWATDPRTSLPYRFLTLRRTMK